MTRAALTRSFPRSRAALLTIAMIIPTAACNEEGANAKPELNGNPVVVQIVEEPVGPDAPTKPTKLTKPANKRMPVAVSADPLRSTRLERFASTTQFHRYLAALRAEYKRQARPHRRRRSAGLGGLAASKAAPPSAEASPVDGMTGDADSITNNQEAGVDEGDIVKATGDFFVILRRGRIFSVRQRSFGGATLTAAGRANAYPPGGSRGTWYDEMLIHRDQIIVIGYSYRVGGTEVGLFRLGAEGQITHEATHFLRSNDYYSSRNYASRLVGSKLIFYMPYYLRYHGNKQPLLPAVTSWHTQHRRARPWREVLSKLDIYQPVQRTLNPTLHTVVQCDLARPSFGCSARAVIGPYSRTFYVARDAVYIWVAENPWSRWGAYSRPKRQEPNPAHLYRLPILGGEVTAVRTRGNPVDQFSFKQSADGHLNVLLTARGGGDWMGNPEQGKRGKMALLRLPPSAFSAAPAAAARHRYTLVPRPDKSHSLQNRFVGDWVLWGAGAGWRRSAANGGQLLATNVRRPAAVQRISLDHGVDRIEALGRHAVVVGSGKRDLFFTSVALGDRPKVRHTWVRKDAAQGETRSHGFFFLPTGGGGGTLGLPIRLNGSPGRHLRHGSAEVVYLRVSSALRFTPLGSLAARAGRVVNDKCVVSCVDWYGNARPIFFRGRVFALMGYELVEGRVDSAGTLRELARISYLQPAARKQPYIF